MASLTDEQVKAINQKAGAGFFWIFSTTTIWQIISWILTFLTARILNATDYGLMALGESVTPYLMMLTTLGLETWLLQRPSLSERERGSVLSLLLLLSTTSTVIAFFGAPYLADFYNEPRLTEPLRVLSVIFVLRSLQILPESTLRREFQFKVLGIANMVIGISRGVLQVVLAMAGFFYWSLIVGAVYKEVVTSAWLILRVGLPKSISFDRRIIADALRFGFAVTGSTVFWIIFTTADNVTIGKLFGPEVLGYYAMAYYLATLPLSKLNGALSPVLSPYFCALKDDLPKLRESFLQVSQATLAVIAPILVGLACVSAELIPLLLGEKWGPTIPSLRVLCISLLMGEAVLRISALANSVGKPVYSLVLSFIVALFLPVSFVLLGMRYGLNGIYFTWLVIYPICWIVTGLFLLNRVISISPRALLTAVIRPWITVFVMALFCLSAHWAFAPLVSIGALLCIKVLVGVVVVGVMYYVVFTEMTSAIVGAVKGRLGRS